MRLLINETKTLVNVSLVTEKKENIDQQKKYMLSIILENDTNDMDYLENLFSNITSLLVRNDDGEKSINLDYSKYCKFHSVDRRIRYGVVTTTILLRKE